MDRVTARRLGSLSKTYSGGQPVNGGGSPCRQGWRSRRRRDPLKLGSLQQGATDAPITAITSVPSPWHGRALLGLAPVAIVPIESNVVPPLRKYQPIHWGMICASCICAMRRLDLRWLAGFSGDRQCL